jgi:predicted ATPase
VRSDNPQVVDSFVKTGAPVSGLVGRERELALLLQAFAEACDGHGQLVMLAGEPGIGKTSLASEFERLLRERGAQVPWGRCREDDGAPPFWPWVQVIRHYAASQDPAALGGQMEAGASELVRMVPDVAKHLPEVPIAATDPEPARGRLFDAVATFFRNAASYRPLVIILDDVHRADDASLRLLEFLVPEMVGARLLVVGTYCPVS